MTAFTSTQSGAFNANSTWGGGGHPTSGTDTATISAGHVVTNSAGVTDTCGAITVAATVSSTTKLIINGTFNMAGDITLGADTNLEGNGPGILDLNGHNIQSATS